MSDLGPLLERASHGVELGLDAFEGLLRRRERRARNQRLAAAALATAISLGIGLVALEEWLTADEPQPASTGITTETVANLETLWMGEVGGVVGPPAVGDGIVVSVNERGHVAAFEQDCGVGGLTCDPLWTAEVGPIPTRMDPDLSVPRWLGAYGQPNGPDDASAVAIEQGSVFVVAADGTLSVFTASCRGDGGTCDPRWRADLGADPGSLPQVVDAVVLVPTSDGTLGFDLDCATDGSMCDARWRAEGNHLRVQDDAVYLTWAERGLVSQLDPVTGQAIWRAEPGRCDSNSPAPIRFGDTVYVNCGRQLLALPADCRGTCGPAWVADIPEPFSSGPVVADGVVLLSLARTSNEGGMLAFPVDCASGGDTCTRGHRTDVPYELTSFNPVVADGVVMAVSGRDAGVFAFDPGCLLARDGCDPLWTAFLASPEQPVSSHDVVFLADPSLGTLQAVPARCPGAQPPATEGALGACPALWTADIEPAGPVVVAGEQVFGVGQDGVLYAFGLPGGPASG